MGLVAHPVGEPSTSGWAERASRESYILPRSPLESEACTLPWQGLQRSTVRSGSRRLSSRRAIFLRLILAWERGSRWWRVRRSCPTDLPHSPHVPSAPGSGFRSSVITPGLYCPGHAPLTLASEIWPSAAGTKKRAPEGTRFF